MYKTRYSLIDSNGYILHFCETFYISEQHAPTLACMHVSRRDGGAGCGVAANEAERLARANARMLLNAASKRSSAKNAVRTSRSRSLAAENE